MQGVSQRFRRKRAPVRVMESWKRLWPRRGHHLRFWGIVGKRVRDRRIKSNDHQRVREVCAEVDAELRAVEKENAR